jgi:hypothetical protein
VRYAGCAAVQFDEPDPKSVPIAGKPAKSLGKVEGFDKRDPPASRQTGSLPEAGLRPHDFLKRQKAQRRGVERRGAGCWQSRG